MPSDSEKRVTHLLQAWREGNRGAYEHLVPIIYEEIRRRARGCVMREQPGHTLSATDLVSEVFLRLGAEKLPEFQDRVHFFAVAVRHMRQILVDHARRKNALRRGG